MFIIGTTLEGSADLGSRFFAHKRHRADVSTERTDTGWSSARLARRNAMMTVLVKYNLSGTF